MTHLDQTTVETVVANISDQFAATGSLLFLLLISAIVALLVTLAFVAIRRVRHQPRHHV